MDINKLPKWAKEHIKTITQQKDAAVHALNSYIDKQTPSPFYVSDMGCSGEQRGPSIKKIYIQSSTMGIDHAGVNILIILRDDHIDIKWSEDEFGNNDIALIPTSYQCIKLVNRNNMYPPQKT